MDTSATISARPTSPSESNSDDDNSSASGDSSDNSSASGDFFDNASTCSDSSDNSRASGDLFDRSIIPDTQNNAPILELLNIEIPSNSFPDKYTVYCFDKKLIPNCIMSRYESDDIPTYLTDIYFWIKPSLVTNIKLEVKRNKPDEPHYFVVRLCSKSTIRKSEFFTNLHFDDNLKTCEQQNRYSASILIIPLQDPDRAIVYGFGAFVTLINRFAIIKQWGLKLTASKDICCMASKDRIKELTVKTPYDYNQKIKTTKASVLENIEVFTPLVGAEIFHTIRLRPDNISRLVKGSDRFEFHLRTPKEDETPSTSKPADLQTSMHRLIQSLVDIGHELYEISMKSDNIHTEYQDYIAKEVVDKETKEQLDHKLVKILQEKRDDYDKYFLCLNPEVFQWGLGIKLKYAVAAAEESGQFLDVLHQTMAEPDANLQSPIIVTNHQNKSETEHVFALLLANVIEYDEKHYYHASGRWFVNPETRFAYIQKMLKRKKIEYETLGLIQYTKEQHENKTRTNKGNLISPELRYNIDLVNALSQEQVSAIKVILIDQIFIGYQPRTNTDKFEFGDVFITDNRQPEKGELHYILHVKRKEVHDFERQCNQVIRCAEFLCKVTTKKFHLLLLVQGCINSLYSRHGLEMKVGVIKNDKNLTHGNTIKLPSQANGWQDTVIRDVIKRTAHGETEFQKGMKANASIFFQRYKILDNCKKECVASINALFDCDAEKKLSFEEAEIFFRAVEHFIRIANKIFNKSKLNKEVRKRTHIIFAIIDDSATPPALDSETGDPIYFTKNQLLALELVQQRVDGSKFQFGWTLIANNFKKIKVSKIPVKRSSTPVGTSKRGRRS